MKEMRSDAILEAKSLKQLKNIFKKDVKAYNSGKDLSQDATQAFMYYGMKNGEIRTDDPDEFDRWLEDNIEESIQEKLSPKEMEKRLAMIKKAVEKINKKNADQAKKDALKMMKDSGMFDEGIDEGKYTAYSDLLIMKARIIDKEGPKSNKIPAVDDAIRIAMKKLGVKEDNVNEAKLETIVLSYDLIKLIGGMPVMNKLMKKHKAYAADKQNVPGKLAISSKIAMGPKGGLIDAMNDILIKRGE
jgi:hypothetical protein